ncbi:MAG: uracil-DNA glycosylase family protein [Planctomycetaceae bacterium]
MSDPPPDPSVTARAIVQSLRGWSAAGVTHLLRPAPQSSDTPGLASAMTSQPERLAAVEPPPAVISPPRSAPPHDDSIDMPSPRKTAAPAKLTLDQRNERLAALARKVARCTRCQELAEARTQTVFGVGNPQARVMFIGEAPGADEDAQGEPFVGRAGQLLNRIIAACGWRREDIYICNILRCRPPGNRNPSDTEAANCREYLDGQIAIVNPEYIVCWGSVAARNLLGREDPIGRLREQWFEHGGAQVLCTYHPSYLLRNPAAKKPVWEDMKLLLKAMGLEPPSGAV